jgi:hypothetical protein
MIPAECITTVVYEVHADGSVTFTRTPPPPGGTA